MSAIREADKILDVLDPKNMESDFRMLRSVLDEAKQFRGDLEQARELLDLWMKYPGVEVPSSYRARTGLFLERTTHTR